MMSNLFSTFDPCSHLSLSINWSSSIIWIFLIPTMIWMLPSRHNHAFLIIIMKMYSEFKMLLGKSKTSDILLFPSMFLFILMNNFMGLMPYIFTSSSHLAFTLTLAVPMWLSLMLTGWINNTQNMFAHLIPEGSPPILMPFMVCIETISNLIRPGSLAVRLTANMIAGHLLMSLLGNNLANFAMVIIPIIMIMQLILMLFETAVSLIQAYVFSVLSTLYTSEVIYEQ